MEDDSTAKVVEEQSIHAQVVVGIGASAGGLEALRVLLSSLPVTRSMAYVVIQHLSPKHESLLSELLMPPEGLAVKKLESGVAPAVDTVYVAPPNANVICRNGRLELEKTPSGPGPTPSVNVFFKSLATEFRTNATAVVLSGTGTDGASGVRAIKGAGGTVIVQDPNESKYDGMPRAAIATEQVDHVLVVEAIGRTLGEIGNFGKPLVDGHVPVPPDQFDLIAATVRRVARLDLDHYKRSTITRRIARRIATMGVADLDEYQALLDQDSQECFELAREMLISVTEFNRDAPAFAQLRAELRRILRDSDSEETIRCWVPGCATGEEAYSIAIEFFEACRLDKVHRKIIVFATDLDNQALDVARNGVYPASAIQKFNKTIQNRYFEADEQPDKVRVVKRVRQSLVISSQNVVDDPPFSRIDLVSCRNLLIYLVPATQRRVFERLHFALRPGGLLFLGAAESCDSHEDLFAARNRQARIYTSVEKSAPNLYPASFAINKESARARQTPRNNARSIADEIRDAMLTELVPAAVLLDGGDMVRQIRGDMRDLMRLPEVVDTPYFFEMIEDDHRADLRALVSRVRREGGNRTGRPLAMSPVPGADKGRYLTPRAVRMDGLRSLYSRTVLGGPDAAPVLLSFEISVDKETAAKATGSAAQGSVQEHVVKELERELAETREHLNTVVAELETANEELQSQSEELQSANEELQTTNEELQTTNEELQTTNEELQTTNEELSTVNDSLATQAERVLATNSLLDQLKESLPVGVLVVDDNLRVVLSNKGLDDLVSFGESTDAEPAQMLSGEWNCDLDSLLSCTRQVIKQRRSAETLFDTHQGRRILMTAAPFNQSGRRHGAVLSFADISSQRDIELAIAFEKERVNALLDAIADAVIGVDVEGSVTYVNTACVQMFARREGALLGEDIKKLISPDKSTSAAELIHALEIQLRQISIDHEISGEFQLQLRGDQESSVHASIRRIRADDNYGDKSKEAGVVLVLRDVTDQRVLTDQLSYQAAHDSLTGLVNRSEFMRRSRRAHEQVVQIGATHALIYMDLDNFKLVNDQCGHAAGDELLRQIAAMIQDELRGGDIVGRLGGDEFAALLVDCPIDKAESIAINVINRVLEYRFRWHSKEYSVGMSIGLTDFNADASLAEVLTRADSACYGAKQSGRGRCNVVLSGDASVASEHSDLRAIAKISRAIEQDTLELCAEKVVDVHDQDKILYKELLVRLRDDDGTLWAPERFVPAAERFMVIGQIDRWVLERCLAHIQAYEPDGEMAYAINLSGLSLGDRHFAATAAEMVKSSGINPNRIIFEITETRAVQQLQDAISFMSSLNKLGCRFALDDFGVGVSSFNYLKQLPVDFLKIDGSFVSNLVEDSVDRKMVEAVHSIGQEMGIHTIAEHVEKAETVEVLKSIGVDCMQGFLFGKGKLLPTLERRN